jgi:hypothetical protein
MRGVAIFSVAVLGVSALLVGWVGAEDLAIRRRGGGGWGAKTQYGLLFNPKTVQSFEGVALSYEKFTPLRQMAYGYLLVLKTPKEIIPIHVGPGWYVEKMRFRVVPGERVWVRGSRILIHEKPVVIATEVKTPSGSILLRMEDGFPVWSEERYKDVGPGGS